MGFQLVEANVWGETKELMVFNSDRAIDVTGAGLAPGDDAATILANGLKIVDVLKDESIQTTFMAPQPSSFKLLNARIPAVVGKVPSKATVKAALPSSLVKHVVLTGTRTFHRFSAFRPDRRVDPVTGDFLAGTYACPESEVRFLPTGFAVVGRFALPVNLPASKHYEILAPIGTVVDFGTVAPAFGQAGGGVEAFFTNAVVNATAPSVLTLDLDDE